MTRLLLAAALLLAAPAMAQTPPPPIQNCYPMAKLIAGAAEQGITLVPLDARALEQATLVYNNTPPVSESRFEAGFAGTMPNGGGIVFLGNGVASCDRMTFKPGQWDKIRVVLFGREV